MSKSERNGHRTSIGSSYGPKVYEMRAMFSDVLSRGYFTFNMNRFLDIIMSCCIM